MRRITIIALLVLAFVGCEGNTDLGTELGEEPAAEEPAEQAEDAPAERVAPPPITLSGSGQQATEPFDIQGGITIFRMTHSGDANWAPVLMNAETGDREELLANEIGSFDGSKLAGLDAGSYLIDVAANGAWNITIEQPRPNDAPSPPQTLTGNSQAVAGPVKLSSGLARFQMSHTGDANWAPILFADDGSRVALLANEIGSFEGSKAEQIPVDGIYWFDVTANGSWSIAISQ